MDHAALFAALPTPHLAVTAAEYVIVDANDAYLGLFGLRREQIVGRSMLEVFPPSPASLDEHGVPVVLRSFERARDRGRPDPMPVERYDIADAATGELVTRYWSHVVVPVFAADGSVELLVQRLDEVTDYVRALHGGELPGPRTDDQGDDVRGWEGSADDVEAALFARGRELQLAREAEAQAAAALTALAEVGTLIASAADVQELSAVFTGAGLALLGASAGSVSVTDGDVVRSTTDAECSERVAEHAGLPVGSQLLSPVVAASGVPVLLPDPQACVAFAPGMDAVLRTSGLQAMVGYPLRHQGRLLGALTFGWPQPRVFTPQDEDVFASLAAQTAQTLARIQAAEADRARAADAVSMSEALQRSLLTEPEQPDLGQVVVRYRAAGKQAQIGGDWYDSFRTSDGTLCLVIGDVSGHDRQAAAVMGQLRNLLRGIAHAVGDPPGLVLRAMDRAMRDLRVGALATAVLATVEDAPDQPGGRRLRWSNAGHLPPLLLSPDGTVQMLVTEADLLLGLDPDTARGDHTQLLPPGSTVLLYTDGLMERRGADLDDGVQWLRRAVEQLAGLPPDELCDALLTEVGGHTDDDICLLAVHLPGSA
jgi:serine phosphatase RsbU (regulator of sigma subunit)